MMEKINLRVLKPTRQKPKAGDIFKFQLESTPATFYFGRVISTDTKIGGFPGGVILIYLYNVTSGETIPQLKLSSLLTAPIGTNALPWTKGFFEVVENRRIEVNDLLPKHCFRDARGWYFDENANRLSTPYEPIGVFGLHSYKTIDEEIGKALKQA